MNYYEYAPPIFRWILGNTNIKPWEMFPWFWGFFLLLSIVIIIFACIRFVRNKNKIINIMLLMIGATGLCVTPFLDKFYLDYEWRNALSQPGFYINKQVKANNYVDVQTFYSDGKHVTKEHFLELPSLKIDKDRYTHTEFKTKDNYCNDTELGPYQFIESGYINDRGNKGQLTIAGKSLKNPNKKMNEDYGIYYREKREDGCYEGTRDHIQSRYYVMREEQTRVGLGLARQRTVIVDSETGEILGYMNYFYTDRNTLFKLTLGRLDNVLPHGTNYKVGSAPGNKIIGYRNPPPRYSEPKAERLIRYVLIPTYYYENPEGGVL